jgi:NAD(P)-dependent dehydrogenase (short-subunit alcohol dehydrogenase family)
VAYDVNGKRVLVTGASAGIGAALAIGFAERGATVGICARRADRLADVLDACRRHAPDSRSWVTDLADLDGVTPFAEEADDALGGIDILVNNAGMPKRRKVAALSLAELDNVMALNYLSPARLTMALLPRMLERGGGHVVNISSVAARLSPPGEASYAASKAALSAFTECLAVELWDSGVRMHLVNPGVIDTELFQLPDNDPLLAPIEALPVSVVVDAVMAQLDDDAFEVYVPEWFGDIAKGKASDVGGFLAGSAAWAREQEQARANDSA